MSNSINDGGPAFPGDDNHGRFNQGLSMRDYFAAKALQMIVVNDISGRPENFHRHYAEGAYEWADAMIAAREAKP